MNAIARCGRLALLVAGAAFCGAAATPDLDRLKEMYLQTDLAAGGAASCIIAIPTDPAYGPLASRVADAVEQHVGVRPPVRPANVQPESEMTARHLIALGVFANNPVIERLYHAGLVNCDWSWPTGQQSYELRTVHNPWLNGRNVICLSSVSSDGCAAAVDRFAAILASQAGSAVEPLIEVSPAPAPPSAAQVDALLQRIAAETSSRSMGGIVVSHADSYFTSGQPPWARLFLAAMRRLDALHQEEGDASDLRSCRYLFRQFDRIEEGPAFSAAERLELAQLFYRLATRMPYAKGQRTPSAIPHGNDWNAIAASYAGLYFTRYYPDLAVGQTLLRNIEVYNEPNMTSWKVNEDCPGYGDITLTGNCDWALARPDWRYIERNSLRRMVDYDLLISDNNGRASGFGDFSGFSVYEVSAYALAAWLYKDSRYLWWWDRHLRRPSRYWVPPELLARRAPVDLVGVRRAPLDDWLYRSREPGRTGQIPQERGFDKVSFRSGLEATDQYLCLSGISHGFHSHADVNTIVRYADQGRICLYDDGYMIPALSEHNTVIILKNGWAARTPDFSQVTAEADFPGVGLFESRVDAYNGVSWDRAVIWTKGRHFLVIDELRALEPARYSFQCLWRTLGRARLEGRHWSSEQKGSRFHLLAASDAALSQRESAGTSLNAEPYPLTEARSLVQASARELAAGQSICFANLFYTEDMAVPARTVDVCRSQTGTTWFVRDDGQVAAVGVTACAGVPGVELAAEVFVLNSTRLRAAGVRAARVDPLAFRVDRPIDLDLDLTSGSANIVSDAPANLTVMPGTARFSLVAGGQTVALTPLTPTERDHLAGALSAARESAAAADQAPAGVAATTGQGLHLLWEYSGFRILANAEALAGIRLRADRSPLPSDYVGHGTGAAADLLRSGANTMFPAGQTVRLSLDLPAPMAVVEVVVNSRQLRTFRDGCGVRRLTVWASADGFTGDRRQVAEFVTTKDLEDDVVPCVLRLAQPAMAASLQIEAIPYSEKHKVYLDSVRVMVQADRTTAAESGFQINGLAVCDLDRDGRDEVFAAGTDRLIHAVRPDGSALWQHPVGGTANALAVADSRAAGAGVAIVAACEDRTLYAVTADGKSVFAVEPPPRTYARAGYRGVKPFQSRLTVAFSGDLDRDGAAEIVVGSANWRTYVYDRQGKLLWDEVCWAHTPTCGATFDLDGDGRQEVVMGNSYAAAVVYSPEGKTIGNAGGSGHAGPTAIACADLDGNGKGEVVVGDRAGVISFVEWKGRALPSYETGSDITAVTTFDADGDGKLETAAASRNQMLYLFDRDGMPLRQIPLLTTCRALLAADMVGDAAPELVCACEDGQVRILTPAGAVLARFSGGGWMRRVAVCELDGDPRTREIVAACDDGRLYALQAVR